MRDFSTHLSLYITCAWLVYILVSLQDLSMCVTSLYSCMTCLYSYLSLYKTRLCAWLFYTLVSLHDMMCVTCYILVSLQDLNVYVRDLSTLSSYVTSLQVNSFYVTSLCAWLLCVRDLIFARNFQVFLENIYFSWNEFYFTSLAESKCSKCDSHAICEKGLCKCRPQYIGNGLTCEPEKEPSGRGRWINKITFLPAIVSQGLRKTFPSSVTAIRLMMLG